MSRLAWRKLLKRAAEADALVAVAGTEQGSSGLYVNEDGHISRWRVTPEVRCGGRQGPAGELQADAPPRVRLPQGEWMRLPT